MALCFLSLKMAVESGTPAPAPHAQAPAPLLAGSSPANSLANLLIFYCWQRCLLIENSAPSFNCLPAFWLSRFLPAFTQGFSPGPLGCGFSGFGLLISSWLITGICYHLLQSWWLGLLRPQCERQKLHVQPARAASLLPDLLGEAGRQLKQFAPGINGEAQC